MTKLNGLLTELTRKRAYHWDQLNRIDAAITSLKGIDGIQEQPADVWVKESAPTKIAYRHGKLHPHDFARDYIRRAGKEVPMKELYREYCRVTNQNIPTNPKIKNRHYSGFSGYFSTARIKKAGFTRKLYQIEGVGKETYVNVDSAIRIQSEKTEQFPNNVVREVI